MGAPPFQGRGTDRRTVRFRQPDQSPTLKSVGHPRGAPQLRPPRRDQLPRPRADGLRLRLPARQRRPGRHPRLQLLVRRIVLTGRTSGSGLNRQGAKSAKVAEGSGVRVQEVLRATAAPALRAAEGSAVRQSYGAKSGVPVPSLTSRAKIMGRTLPGSSVNNAVINAKALNDAGYAR